MRCTRYKGTDVKYVTVNAGGNGGTTSVRLFCNSREILSSAHIRYNSWLDRLELTCTTP